MRTSSAKAKGRKLQQIVRDGILELHPELTRDDVRSTSMGATGVDVQLSAAAKRLFPWSVECKSRSSMAVYDLYLQARENTEEATKPLLVVKQNHSEPLAILSLEDFLCLLKQYKSEKTDSR